MLNLNHFGTTDHRDLARPQDSPFKVAIPLFGKGDYDRPQSLEAWIIGLRAAGAYKQKNFQLGLGLAGPLWQFNDGKAYSLANIPIILQKSNIIAGPGDGPGTFEISRANSHFISDELWQHAADQTRFTIVVFDPVKGSIKTFVPHLRWNGRPR